MHIEVIHGPQKEFNRPVVLHSDSRPESNDDGLPWPRRHKAWI